MTNREAIEVFFSRSVEKTFNDSILDDKNYVIPPGALDNYIATILSVPYGEYIDYLKERREDLKFTSQNISQFSSFSACEIDMCNALLWNGNQGLTFVEIGKLFPDYVKQHNTTAYNKFGENQVKTAAQLGLAFEYYDLWFLSCLGYIYPSIPDEKKDPILARMILRDPLYANIVISLTEGDVDLLKFMESELSPKTSARRYSNVVTIANIAIAECHREGISIGAIMETKKQIPTHITAEEYKIVAGKTILLDLPVNRKLFEDGFVVPSSKHDLWKKYFEITSSQPNALKYINLLVDKKPFKALLSCSIDADGNQMMQVYYEDTPVVSYLAESLHVSYDYLQLHTGNDVDIPSELSESIAVYAANRNDTIYIVTNTVAKQKEESEPTTIYQGVKDLDYYKGCFRDISISRDNKKVIIGKLCMILALAEYVRWLDETYDELSNHLPILGTWEGNYIRLFSQYHSAKRTSTLFSSPFFLLNDEPFWQVVKEDGTLFSASDGDHAMMTFLNIQESYSNVIVDQELLDFLIGRETSVELCDYVRNLLNKI